jgi:large repetitive protein
MVQAIDFAVRDSAGAKQHGSVAGDSQGNFIRVRGGDDVSLNLTASSIVSYEQQGGDLLVTLSDGRVIVLNNYFNGIPGLENHLYLSANGEMTEVLMQRGSDGVLYADYGPVSGWEKWSPLDDLRFTTTEKIADALYFSTEPAGMAPFSPGLLGGFGGGSAGAVAAAAGGLAVLGAGGTSSGGSNTAVTPADTTAPVVVIDQGTKTVAHVESGADYQNGVQIAGTSEPAAQIVVLLNGYTQTTTTGADGTWSVTYPTSQVPAGQYEIPVVVTATDAAGNSASKTDTLVVDTLVQPFTHTTSSTGSDAVLNGTEYAQGLTVGGAVEAGSTVQVKLDNGTTHAATVVGGNWTYTFASGEISPGDLHSMQLTAIATDKYGNVSSPIVTPINIDTLVSDFLHTTTDTSSVKADAVLNEAEALAGLNISGTVEPGSVVMVKLGTGVEHQATVTNGTWSYTFPASEVTPGDLHNMSISAYATDAYGNRSATFTTPVQVDTVVSNFAHTSTNTSAVKVDAILNAAETQLGLQIAGTVEPGSVVMVKLGSGPEHAATVTNGTWSYTFPASEVTAGDLHTMSISAYATDAYGNRSVTQTTPVQVDTSVSNFVHTLTDTSSVKVDNILNAAEAMGGLRVGGTVEMGSSVMVKLGTGPEHAAIVTNGVWSYTFPTSEITPGDLHSMQITATATDVAGNVSTPITSSVLVDTLVSNFAAPTALLAGDGILNASEAAQGLLVSGTAEVGAAILVHMQNGVDLQTTADALGNWSVTFATADLPTGNGSGGATTVTVTATDLAGNVAHYDRSFAVDTVLPADPWIIRDEGGGNQIDGIVTETSPDVTTFHIVANGGNVVDIIPSSTSQGTALAGGSTIQITRTYFDNSPVPDGSYLVVSRHDTAGNESSTLYIRSTTGGTTVDMSRAGLDHFDFGTINLTASQASLTLNATQLNALTGPDKSMTIAGGADDHVTLVAAIDSGTDQTINGQTYHMYTLGTSGGNVLIDSDIIVSHTLV